MRTLDIVDLGETPYRDCWALQQAVHERRRSGLIGDTLLLTTHPHVYTIGKTGDDDHLLAGPDELRRAGAEVVRTDRGGDITYHGPGQLVAYPIIGLGERPDVHRYLRDLESVIIATLAEHGIRGGREPGYTGVWVAGEKIAAIGVRAAGWVTMHGFALNVNTDLSFFRRIIPCGIAHMGVTSMAQCIGAPVDMQAVRESVEAGFGAVFGSAPRKVTLAGVLGDQSTITAGV
jgi:lipoyl(octanoyl) transferase